MTTPVAGESMWSWLHRYSTDIDCPTGVLADRLGLPLRPDGTVTRVRLFGIHLPRASTTHLTEATGLPSESVDGLQLSRFHGTGLDLSRLDPSNERSLTQVVKHQWLLPHASRVCARCLAEDPTVWPLWWKLGYAAACPRHAVLLLDECPTCRIPFTRGYRRHPRALSRDYLVDVAVCGSGSFHDPCDQLLCQLPQHRISAGLVAAQLAVLDALGVTHEPGTRAMPPTRSAKRPAGRARDALTMTGRVPPPQELANGEMDAATRFAALRDLAAMTLACGAATDPNSLFALPRATHDAPPARTRTAQVNDDALAAALETVWHRDRDDLAPRVLYRSSPATAALAGALLLATRSAMSAASHDELAEAAAPVTLAYLASRDWNKHDPLRWSGSCEPIARIVRQLNRPRRGRIVDARRPSPGLATGAGTRSDATALRVTGDSARFVPQLMPTDLYRAHVADHLDEVADATGRCLASIAAARLLGASSWRAAATLLGIPEPRGRRAIERVRKVADADQFWAGVAACLDALGAAGDDYRAAERRLSTLAAVPYREWQRLCRPHNVVATQQRAQHAAVYLWERVAGADWRDSPALEDGWWPRTTRESRHEGQRRFALQIPSGLRADLEKWASTDTPRRSAGRAAA
ncbi:TniQ family protein [Nocardioides sp. URHA0020]|uniref:TniQ family protein n=1 Tax=Nocardioides sp. URHA0020 TaxID=1380392 RepID=UPI0012DC421D|nr:TniQ family protein [Nocardioides sp. URHA0020]